MFVIIFTVIICRNIFKDRSFMYSVLSLLSTVWEKMCLHLLVQQWVSLMYISRFLTLTFFHKWLNNGKYSVSFWVLSALCSVLHAAALVCSCTAVAFQSEVVELKLCEHCHDSAWVYEKKNKSMFNSDGELEKICLCHWLWQSVVTLFNPHKLLCSIPSTLLKIEFLLLSPSLLYTSPITLPLLSFLLSSPTSQLNFYSASFSLFLSSPLLSLHTLICSLPYLFLPSHSLLLSVATVWLLASAGPAS